MKYLKLLTNSDNLYVKLRVKLQAAELKNDSYARKYAKTLRFYFSTRNVTYSALENRDEGNRSSPGLPTGPIRTGSLAYIDMIRTAVLNEYS